MFFAPLTENLTAQERQERMAIEDDSEGLENEELCSSPAGKANTVITIESDDDSTIPPPKKYIIHYIV